MRNHFNETIWRLICPQSIIRCCYLGENEWNSKISSSTARIATACILLLFLPNHFWLTLRQRRKSFRRNYKRWANWQMVGQRLTGDGPIIRGSLAGTRKRGHRPRHLRQVTFWSSGLGCISSPEGRRILLYGFEYFDTTFKHFNTGFKGTNYVSFLCILYYLSLLHPPHPAACYLALQLASETNVMENSL